MSHLERGTIVMLDLDGKARYIGVVIGPTVDEFFPNEAYIKVSWLMDRNPNRWFHSRAAVQRVTVVGVLPVDAKWDLDEHFE